MKSTIGGIYHTKGMNYILMIHDISSRLLPAKMAVSRVIHRYNNNFQGRVLSEQL
jgi:hypothetical protein